jgi:tetratricopeptide (TPR) repeat protein
MIMKDKETIAEKLKEKITPRNPLGIIALFVSFIEAVATVSLKIVADARAGILWAIVLFIILYPTIIAIFFFVILWKKREILFGPMDFPDPKSFENILLQGFQRIEVKQEAAIIDVNTALNDVYKTIDKLMEFNDIWTAVQVGRSYLERKEFDKSLQIFQYMLNKVSPSNESYCKVLANAAYSMIGKNDYENAIEYLRRIESLNRGRHFWTWHSLALAYAYFRKGEKIQYQKYLNKAKKLSEEGYDIDVNYFSELYPEIEADLRKKWK